MFTDLWATFARWRVWYLQGNQDIQMRYRRSALGPFWISLSMAALIVGLALLYGQLFQMDFEDYITFLAPGFLAWFFIAAIFNEGCTAVVDNESHMRSVPLPISVAAARATYRNFIIFLHNAVVVLAIQAVFGVSLSVTSLIALGGVAYYILLGVSVSMALAPICARFRDIPQIIANVMQIAFFLSPVLWRPQQLSADVQFIALYNPLYHVIELIREPLLGNAPSLLNWYVSFGLLGAMLILAMISVGVSRKRVYLWI